MILIKLSEDTIVNADNIQGIRLVENAIECDLPGDQVYRREYEQQEEANEAFNKLFMDLAQTPGVDGAVID